MWAKDHTTPEVYKRLIDRVKGKNQFCQPILNQEFWVQGSSRNVGRYTMFNHLSLLEHGTVEIRLLPGFSSADELLGAVQLLLKILNKHVRIFSKCGEKSFTITSEHKSLQDSESTEESTTARTMININDGPLYPAESYNNSVGITFYQTIFDQIDQSRIVGPSKLHGEKDLLIHNFPVGQVVKMFPHMFAKRRRKKNVCNTSSRPIRARRIDRRVH